MPRTSKRKRKKVDTALSTVTKKQIDTLPERAQHIFKKAHANTVKQCQNPKQRRGGRSQTAEEVAHKTAWVAVKQEYKKQGDELLRK